jgi:hypothetical protein
MNIAGPAVYEYKKEYGQLFQDDLFAKPKN